MKKRILSVILAALMLCSLIPIGAAAAPETTGKIIAQGSCGENVVWKMYDNGTLNISGSGNMADPTDSCYVENPNGGYNIINVSPWKAYVGSIKKLVVERGVGNIGQVAFANCTELSELSIASSVRDIGAYAFYNCPKISKLDLPTSVVTVQYSAFESCSGLLSVSVPKSVSGIGDAAFKAASSIGDVYYAGSSSAWNGINVGKDNAPLTQARRHVNCSNIENHYTITKVQPTCTERGYTKHSCTCGYSYKDSYVSALGHEFVNGKCTRCGVSEGTPVNPFTDIGGCSQSFQTAIIWASSNGIAAGTSATTYNPNGSCTRGQVVTFLWRAAGKPEPTTANNPYNDVASSAYYYKAILWAAENGITAGYNNADGSKSFKPGATVTRGQFVTFLWRYLGKPAPATTVNPFNDVSAGGFYNAILWGSENGIVAGYKNADGSMSFRPNNPCTRAHVAVFLYRAMA